MSSFLQYLDNFEDNGQFIIIRLKDFPSSHLSGNKIAEELYRFLFNCENISQKDIEKKEELIYQIKRYYQNKMR